MAPFLFSEEFYTYLLAEKRFSEHTIIAYTKDVEQFYDFSGITTKNELNELNHKLVRGWIVSLVEEGFTNKSINRKLSSVKAYFMYLKKKGMIANNPTSRVQGPKIEKRLPQFAKENELNPIDFASVDDMTELRDALMVELLYQTGMRLSELIGLKNTSVSDSKIKVVGKRNKERIVPISKELLDAIKKYNHTKQSHGFTNDHLILTNKGDKLYPKFVYRKINTYLGKVTDLEKCSPHVLRHTFATHMLNNGAGLETIKELLGHANLSATQVYTHNSFAQLTNIYSLAHPRERKKN